MSLKAPGTIANAGEGKTGDTKGNESMTEQAQGQTEQQTVQATGEGQGQQTPPEPKYTDADIDKYKGTARKEGRQAAVNELLSELGADSLDSLKEGYSGWTEAQELAKSDLEKEKAAREAAEKTAQDKDQSLASLRKEYALRDALRGAEINPERLDLALRVADTDSLEIEGGKVTNLDTAVDALTQSSPEWFGSTGANGGGDIGRGSGPGGGNQPKDIADQIRDAEKAGNFQLAIALKSQLNNTA